MSAQNYTPGVGNAPFGNLNTNPESSNYQVDSQFSPEESILIQKAVRKAIFDAAPAQYNALKLLSMRAPKDKNNDEFSYLEKTFGRSPIESTAIVAAVAAVPGASQTQTIPLTAASMDHVTLDLIVIYPDNTKAVITAIGASDITVTSQTGDGLSAVAALDIFSFQSTIESDGMDTFSNYSRLETIERYNYIQFFRRAQRWARVEMQKHVNSATTDYLTHDKQHKMNQLRVDFFNSYFNGQRGEFPLSGGRVAKAMGGIYPTMQTAGSASANPTVAGLQVAFEALAFQTNFKVEGGTRFIYGTDEILNEFSKIYKQPGLRYAPNDTVANLKLNMIELGTMKFVLVPCELFREESCFPAEWRRKVLVLDQDAIFPVKMKGIPAVEMGQTLNIGKNGTRENYTDFWVGGQLSLEFNNPLGSFYMDIQ